jgi:hypothetical protein
MLPLPGNFKEVKEEIKPQIGDVVMKDERFRDITGNLIRPA